jgi:hypothetical protein
MTIPGMLLGTLIAGLYGALFHLIRGGSFGRLLLYLLLAVAGFWGGQLLGNYLGFKFLIVGPLNLGSASIGAVILLLAGYFLSLVQADPKK